MTVPTSIPNNAPTNVKHARQRFLNVHGARLFNLLPKSRRNENSTDFPLFKNHLPTMAGLARAAVTNSLLGQVPLVPDLDLG